ncbi:MAG: hypothetical protein KCHDKBKB_00642 [Elusimicrobia bacterium]|nr:hypothetical protein [Elusimicrobiota bacterium]
MYFYDENINGWVIKSNNKLDYWISYLSLVIFEFVPFFLEGIFLHGAKQFIITRQTIGKIGKKENKK